MFKKFSAAVLAIVSGLAIWSTAYAQTAYKPEFRLSSVVGQVFVWTKSGEYFADEVRERTNGRINIKVYPGASLMSGQQLTHFTAIELGVADFGIDSTIDLCPQIKELNLFSLPFFFPKGKYIYDAVDAVIESEVGKTIENIMEQKGVMVLAWGEDGFRQLTNRKKEVKTPADMQGLKIRVVGPPIFNEIYQVLGAEPMTINWHEVVSGLKAKVVDGFEGTANTIMRGVKAWEHTKYITNWYLCH